MQFSTLTDFVMMDGHGLYVWLSYAIATTLIIVNLVLPMLTRKALLKDLARRVRREKNTHES